MNDYTKSRIIRILDDIADDLSDFEAYFDIDYMKLDEQAYENIILIGD